MREDERKRFGANLRAAREARDESQRDLARATGISQGSLSAIEQGRGNPTFGTMAKLAAAVGKLVHELLAPPPPPTDTLK